MVDAALTEQMIDSGATLIRKLDERGLAPDAAFWFYLPDRQEWSLVIAEAKLASKGPRWMYGRIRDAISESTEELHGLSLDTVSVVKPDIPIVSLLMAAIGTGDWAGIRFTNNVINGTVVEDAYIYRMRPAGHGPARRHS
jgi:hypothetical protein